MSFAVVYRWRLKEGADGLELRAAWEELTQALRREHGGLGSCLHRTADGEYLAYARWPDRKTWESSQALPSPAPEASRRMRACVDVAQPPLPLEIEADLLRKPDSGRID